MIDSRQHIPKHFDILGTVVVFVGTLAVVAAATALFSVLMPKAAPHDHRSIDQAQSATKALEVRLEEVEEEAADKKDTAEGQPLKPAAQPSN